MSAIAMRIEQQAFGGSGGLSKKLFLGKGVGTSQPFLESVDKLS